MYDTQISQYKKQSVELMSPEERVILLYDTAITNLKASKVLLNNGDLEKCTECLSKSRNIFFHMETVLDPDLPISEDLAACYAFFRRQISETVKTRDSKHIDVIIPQAESLRDAFFQAAQSISKGGTR